MEPNRKGFTLVELLVVIGILGVLAAFIFPAIQSARRSAMKSKTRTNIAALTTAIKGYFSDFNAYPDFDGDGEAETDNDLVMRMLTGRYYNSGSSSWQEDDGSAPNEIGITTNKKWNGPYLEMNETRDYKIHGTGSQLMDDSDHFEDGYSTVANRAAYVDGWKNQGRLTYFCFRFPNPEESNHNKKKPIFNRDSFDIWSPGPDGMSEYHNLSNADYNVNDYENYQPSGEGRINKDNITNWD